MGNDRGRFNRKPEPKQGEFKEFRDEDYPARGRSSGRGDSRRGGRDGGRGRSGPPRHANWQDKFDVVCSGCNKDCQVPFKPTSDKPLFCDDCYRNGGQPSNNSRSSPSRDSRPSSRSSSGSADLKEVNDKLDLIMEALGID